MGGMQDFSERRSLLGKYAKRFAVIQFAHKRRIIYLETFHAGYFIIKKGVWQTVTRFRTCRHGEKS
jgi:hypothetical protein